MFNLPFGLRELLDASVIIVAFIIGGMVLTYIMRKYVSKWAQNTKTKLDDLLVEKIKPPFSYAVWFIGIKVALRPLHLEYELLDKILDTIIFLIVNWIVAAIANVVVKYVLEKFTARTESETDDALVPLFEKTIRFIVWATGIVWILGLWGVDIRPILGGLGIAGLAFGFAIKDSLANIFGGISLILDGAIKVGDKVKLEGGESGFIDDVGLRSTRLKTFSNEIIIIPNGQLANSKIQNFGQPDPSLKITIDFGVGYESDVDLVRKIVGESIKSMEGIMDDPGVEVLFLSMEDFYLKFSARFWVPDHGQAWVKKLEATDKIFKTLKENKIDIPYPIQTVIIKK